MGYAGNSKPQYIIPTAIGTKDDIIAGDFVRRQDGLEDLDFYIGEEVRGAVPHHASTRRALPVPQSALRRAGRALHRPCALQHTGPVLPGRNLPWRRGTIPPMASRRRPKHTPGHTR